MALALGILLLVPLSVGLKSSLGTWKNSNERDESIYNLRMAMHRMTTELRYATKLLQAESPAASSLEFETTTLLDSDPGTTETVWFYRWAGNGVLFRKVDYGSGYPAGFPQSCNLAGFPSGPIYVDTLDIIPMKIDGSDNLVPLVIPSDTLDMAVAVQINLTMRDEDQETVTASSLVKMRNLQ